MLGASVAIGLILTLAAATRGDELRVGSRVIQKGSNFELKVDRQVVE